MQSIKNADVILWVNQFNNESHKVFPQAIVLPAFNTANSITPCIRRRFFDFLNYCFNIEESRLSSDPDKPHLFAVAIQWWIHQALKEENLTLIIESLCCLKKQADDSISKQSAISKLTKQLSRSAMDGSPTKLQKIDRQYSHQNMSDNDRALQNFFGYFYSLFNQKSDTQLSIIWQQLLRAVVFVYLKTGAQSPSVHTLQCAWDNINFLEFLRDNLVIKRDTAIKPVTRASCLSFIETVNAQQPSNASDLPKGLDSEISDLKTQAASMPTTRKNNEQDRQTSNIRQLESNIQELQKSQASLVKTAADIKNLNRSLQQQIQASLNYTQQVVTLQNHSTTVIQHLHEEQQNDKSLVGYFFLGVGLTLTLGFVALMILMGASGLLLGVIASQWAIPLLIGLTLLGVLGVCHVGFAIKFLTDSTISDKFNTISFSPKITESLHQNGPPTPGTIREDSVSYEDSPNESALKKISVQEKEPLVKLS